MTSVGESSFPERGYDRGCLLLQEDDLWGVYMSRWTGAWMLVFCHKGRESGYFGAHLRNLWLADCFDYFVPDLGKESV